MCLFYSPYLGGLGGKDKKRLKFISHTLNYLYSFSISLHSILLPFPPFIKTLENKALGVYICVCLFIIVIFSLLSLSLRFWFHHLIWVEKGWKQINSPSPFFHIVSHFNFNIWFQQQLWRWSMPMLVLVMKVRFNFSFRVFDRIRFWIEVRITLKKICRFTPNQLLTCIQYALLKNINYFTNMSMNYKIEVIKRLLGFASIPSLPFVYLRSFIILTTNHYNGGCQLITTFNH